MNGARVAIVGGGVAGLTAAREISRVGAEVLVLDKARRPGGRVSTRRKDELAFDHGAQYFTCRHPGFQAQVSDWCDRGIAAEWTADIVTLDAGARSEARGETRRYVGVPRMSALARDLASGLDVVCSRRIVGITRSGSGFTLDTESGERFTGFAAVVVATPAPQAVPLLDLSPRFRDAVAAIDMQPCHAAMLAFEAPLAADFGGAFVEGSPLAWIARNGSKPGRPDGECWVLQTTPDWSAGWIDAPAERVLPALRQALTTALGAELPRTLHESVHLWRFARSTTALDHPCLWDADLRLGACGDWMLGGRLEGAFESGHSLARAMLADWR